MEFIGDGSSSEDSETDINASEDVVERRDAALTDSKPGVHKRKASVSNSVGVNVPRGQQAKRLKESNVKDTAAKSPKRLASITAASLSSNRSSSSSQSISNFQPSRKKYNSIENIYHADKCILTFDVDRSGHLMIAGGHNCKVEQFELNKSQNTNGKNFLSPVREITPEPGTAVWSVKYNNNCTNFAVACVSPTPSIYDRVCRKVVSFIRGDPYLADMSKTKGHISVVTGISWHPRDREVLLTSSLDGSLRTWNLNGTKHFDALVCNQVVKARDENGRRIGITSSCYDRISGNLVAGVTSRGGLQIWKLKAGTKLDRPQFCNNQANVGCGDLSDVAFVGDGRHLLTRVNRGSEKSSSVIKLWDTRKIGKPLKSITCLKTNENKCTFHLIENTTYLVCPTDTGKDEGAELVNVYNMANRGSDASATIEVESSCICAMYNKKLDTLFMGECDGTISRVKGFAHP